MNKIKQIRKEKGLTQRQLGEASGIDEANIRKYENEKLKPSLQTYRKIATALGIYIGDLVDDWGQFSKEEFEKDWNTDNYFTQDKQELLRDYQKLNKKGQNEARKRVNELTQITEYTE